MVLAYHLILAAYGFWLPNDPRGSWSDTVRQWELLKFGDATKTKSRRSVARKKHDSRLRRKAKDALRYPPVLFTGEQARAAGIGFGNYALKSGLRVWACSILPDHAHLVFGRHRFKAELVANQLKGASTRELREKELHPFLDCRDEHGKMPRCWATRCWKVYLNSVNDIERAIRYVEDNPLKENKPRQKWFFVRTFDPTMVE
jgi:REP element-mobilizing transposase RayT